ncbi:ATP-binding protein [Chromobacterium vaccinii]|uniref:ATP-binding protein n=1 Tax=Chromobacterium vaccinii TaxID=1108595 RepID=UPI0031CED623
MHELDWGFSPAALLEAALAMIEHGDEAGWAAACRAALATVHPPPALARLGLPPLDAAALALALTLEAGHPAAETLCGERGLGLPVLAQLLSPDAAAYPAALAALADGVLLRRRLLLAGTGQDWARLRLSPQLLQQLAAGAGQAHDLNRLLQRLTAPAAPLPRGSLPQGGGWQLTGAPGSGRKSTLLAAAGDTPVYLLNSERFYQFDAPEELLADLLSFVDLNHGWLVWPDEDKLARQTSLLPQLEAWLAGHQGRALVRLAETPEQAPPALAVNCAQGLPTEQEAARLWRAMLPADGIAAADLAALARQFPLLPGDMRRVASAALADHVQPDAAALVRACLAHQPASLGALARRVEPRARLADMELAEAEREALAELALRYQSRHLLRAEGLAHGSGLTALFWGPPGTGKTLAAHALAAELVLPLYQVNLAQLSSKWIGETEKHLATLFDAAERQPCLLFFDEADAVFGKRSEVKDSHDRNANLSVSYLLQRLDDSSALAVLASNFKQNLDPAFLRRFALTVEFSAPDALRRLSLWRRHADRLALPDSALAALADSFELSPAQIANIALGARLAGLARPQSSPAQRLAHALSREFDKTNQRYPMAQRIETWLQGAQHV